MKYIAYTTKGLEKTTQRELEKKLKEVSILEVGDKRVIFSTESSFQDLIDLKTVDDLGIFVVQINNLKTIEGLLQSVDTEDLIAVQELLSSFRSINKTSYSLTVSIAKSPIKAQELLLKMQRFITSKYQWNLMELDHSNFDIRVFIDGKNAYISVRLTKQSLHNRAYKTNSKAGSLKPTVAAAMVLLATNFQKNIKVVDNFCGSGTILCEAFSTGSEVFGGDISSESVMITKNNLSNLGYNPEDKIKLLDARKTNLSESYFDYAISNLPWDKQIEVTSITELYENSIQEYFRILKPTGTLCAVVSKPELFIKYIRKFKPHAKINSLKIGLLGQNPTIVVAN